MIRTLRKQLAIAAGVLALTAQGVQAVTVLDLTTTNASASATAFTGGSFTVQQISPQSTGTGVIDSFLRLQPGGSTNQERGYNTSIGTPLDDLGGNFTKALTLSEIPIVNIGGTAYRQFLLDINQTASSPLLSLNQIQIFQAPSDPGSTFTIAEATATTNAILSGLTGATEIFRMSNATLSAANAYDVQLNFSLNPGSGAGDMFLYVPNSDFTGGPNIILFSQFGTPPGPSATNDGFEEWAVVIPEPPTLTLGCIASLIGLGTWRLRRSAA